MADGLQGYEPRSTQVSQPAQTSAPAIQEAGQGLSNLTSRLQSFSESMFQRQADVVADKAKKRALTDSAEGKPFHEEEVYTVYGKAYNNTLSATYAAKSELAISEKAQQLALDYQNDPVGFSNAMGSYVDGLTKTAPTPALKTSIGIYGEKVKNRAFGSLAIAENNRIKAEQKEVFLQSLGKDLGQIVDMVHAGDMASADLLIQKNNSYIEALKDSGSISPAEALRLEKDAQYKVSYGVSMLKMGEMLDNGDIEGAQAYLKEQTETNRPDMDIPENMKHKADLTKMYKGYLTQQKANLTASKTEAGLILGDAVKVLKSGKTPDNLSEITQAYQFASPAKQHEFDVYSQVAEVLVELEGMSLTEQEDVYNKMKSGETASRVGAEVIESLGKTLSERRTKANNDVVGLAIQEGVIEPSVGMSAQDGVDGLLAGLDEMSKNTFAIQEVYGKDKVDLLSKDDAKSWSDYMNSPNDVVSVDEKLGVIEAIAKTNPENAKKVFSQIGGKNAPTFGFAASLAMAGNTAAAKTALLGKGADVDLPPDYKIELQTRVGNAFGGYDSTVFNRNLNGMIDYAKGLRLQGQEIDSFDDLITNSIGEIVKYNNKDTVLPHGVGQRAFESWLDDIVIEGRPELQKGLRDMTDVFGSGEYQLHFAAPGEYYIKVENNGNPYFVNDKDDPTKPFILKWEK